MRRTRKAWIATLALAGSASTATADTVKMATLAPDGSPWHHALKRMGAEWQQATDGRVQLRLYPGGVAGSDTDILRKMRLGQLQAAGLTAAGLSELDPAFNVFSIPLFFGSFEEFRYVRDALAPVLGARLRERGFVVLHWGYGGWVYLFATKPVRSADELRRVKMFTGAGDEAMAALWRDNGFEPRVLAYTDILTGLQTGMIEALPTTPLAALSFQWYRHAPYMLALGIAPLVGAAVVERGSWERIAPEDRERLWAIAERIGRDLEAEIPGKDEAAVEEMRRRGLTVIRPAEARVEREWREVAEAFARGMRRRMVPPEIFDLALEHRQTFRARGSAAETAAGGAAE